jgi:DedD protein
MSEWNDEHDSLPEPETHTGKMLFYFFGAVVLCAVALSVGYTMGKHSSSAAVETGAPPLASPVTSGAAKPGPSRGVESFPAETAPEPAPQERRKPAAETKSAAASKPAPEVMGMAGKGFMVQVAAVSRQEDADALAGALRKKQYPVFVMPGTGPDKLLHVQVGPFAELKDAEAMKAKLAGDGYNAIVKK